MATVSNGHRRWPSVTIGRLRAHLGIDQHDLAILLGRSQAAVSNWEAGKRIPDLSLHELLGQLGGIA